MTRMICSVYNVEWTTRFQQHFLNRAHRGMPECAMKIMRPLAIRHLCRPGVYNDGESLHILLCDMLEGLDPGLRTE